MTGIRRRGLRIVMLLAAWCGVASAQDALEILRRTGETYRGLHSLEVEGTLISRVSHGDKTYDVTWTVSLARADNSLLPRESPVPALPQLIRRVRRDVTVAGVTAEDVPEGVVQSLPVDWSSFDRIDSSVEAGRFTGEDTVAIGSSLRRCWMLEVIYRPGSRARATPGRPVRYWIDPSSGLVLKQEFSQRDPSAKETLEWSFAVTSMKTNEPPPKWAVDALPELAGTERREWVGREAPAFSLTDLDGDEVKSPALRGKIVVLNFWASWCSPCRDEMAVLEKLRAEFASDGVEVWGVNNESPSIARKWMKQYGRHLPTFLDGERDIYRKYEVTKIPVSVVIDREGRVVSYVEGVRGDFYFRGVVEKLLRID